MYNILKFTFRQSWLGLIGIGLFLSTAFALIASSSTNALYTNGDVYYGGGSSINLTTRAITNNLSNMEVFHNGLTQYSFSPDGKWIAYRTQVYGEYYQDVVIGNMNGTVRRVIASHVLVDAPGNIAWSPDGKKVAYGVMNLTDGMPGYPYKIGIANVDGSGAKIVPNTSIAISKFFGGVTWINNSTLGYIDDIRSFCRILVTGQNKSCKQMPGFPNYWKQAQYLYPKVSPDGTKIMFQRMSGWINDPDPTGPIWTWYDLWVFNADGSNGVKITSNPVIDSASDLDSELSYNMAWSPDSQKVVYGLGYGRQSGLYVISKTGSNKVKYNIGSETPDIYGWRAKQ